MAQSNGSTEPTRITVLISGNGSNLQALIDACNRKALASTTIVRVISDRAKAYGLERAAHAHIPTAYHGIIPYKKTHPDPHNPGAQSPSARRAYDADLARLVLADAPHLVVCAGFMRILTTAFLDPVKSRIPIINLHPSLYGDLVGAHCIDRAWAEFQEGKRTKTGIMIHYVIAEVDKGEMIVQEEVSIKGCGTQGELEERIHEREHGLIVNGTRIAIERLLGKEEGT